MTHAQPIEILTGHYGSGKSELAVHLALRRRQRTEQVLLVDVDVVNPYFRSRERRALLEGHGVQVVANSMAIDQGVDIPAVSAQVYAPLRNPELAAVYDAGGDPVGARILRSFRRLIDPERTDVLCVVNAYRPATRTAEAVVDQIRAIEDAAGLAVTGLINNSHLLEQTEINHVTAGDVLCRMVQDRTGVPIRYVGVPAWLPEPSATGLSGEPIAIQMYLREAWMAG